MNRKQALAAARNRVCMQPQGNQWIVCTWSQERSATWVSQPMDFWHARNAVWEGRVYAALELLGINDAGEMSYRAAHDANYRDIGRWQQAVRRLADQHAYAVDKEEQMRGSIR